jgi:hypothetical protein
MVVPLPDGSVAKIDHLPVTESKETLGVTSSPVGDAAGGLVAMQEKAQEWIDKAKEGHLKRSDVWFLLDGLCCNLAEHLKLEDCLSKQYYNLLPLGGVIRTAPRAARMLGKGFYGIGCPHPGVECFVGQVSKLLMHYGCPSNIGEKMKISFHQLVIELGMTDQPFQLSYKLFKNHVTWSWLVSVWEKCELYGVKIVMNDIPLELPRERDKWLMAEFLRLGFSKKDLERLNRVRLYMQVLFLSEVLGASGRVLDERYLRKRPKHEAWSTLKFPQERPSPADFNLWKQALRQLVTVEGLPVRLGRFLHKGFKRWEWRVCTQENYLLHYTDGVMDVYVPTSDSRRRW